LTRQSNASAVRTPYSIARRLITGSVPGMPWQTGHVCVFGGAPNVVGQPQNILVRVVSWAWTSSPMTTSHLASPRTLVACGFFTGSPRPTQRRLAFGCGS